MSADQIPVSFNCKDCGAKLEWSDDAIDTTEIRCKNCGKYFGTYRDLRDTALKAVRDKAEAIIKDALKRSQIDFTVFAMMTNAPVS